VPHAPSNAEANVQSDWNASSGDELILNKPTIPADENAVWGNIAGTLSDQTDLQNVLNIKMESVVAGNNITVDATDPNNPIVSSVDQDLSVFAEKTNVLELDNTSPFTPSADYEPATKKFVVDADAVIQGNVDSNEADISALQETVANLASMTGKFVLDILQPILTTTSIITWDILNQSNDTNLAVLNADNTITIKASGNYDFSTAVRFDSTTNNSVNCTFNWLDISDDTVLHNRTAIINIGNNQSDNATFSDLLIFEEADVPITIRLESIAGGTGIAIGNFETTLSSSSASGAGIADHGSLTGRNDTDSHPQSAITNLTADLLTLSDAITLNTAKVSSVATMGTGTILSLTNVDGIYYNMSSASSATNYTTTGITIGAWAKCLINAPSEPTVTGATKIKSPDFIANTDMGMVVGYDGNQVTHFFLER